ncbi:hypothetical protein OG449_15135 [Streptomyces globisporus]|nr:hypothetical protein OG449_15135 [Streptomyces globisporus]
MAGRVAEVGEAGSMLVIAAGELHVVQDDPVVRREQLGQRGQPGQEIRLVNGTQPARLGQVTR